MLDILKILKQSKQQLLDDKVKIVDIFESFARNKQTFTVEYIKND